MTVNFTKDSNIPTRATVDFSGPSRATARDYAGAAQSRILKSASNAVLKDAAFGYVVDAYDLNEALLDAMRSATTRLGQSMARRDLARKIAYLGHIVQAVLNNAADGLPAYDIGERSRLLEEVKPALTEARIALDHSTTVNQRLTEDLTTTRRNNESLNRQLVDSKSVVDKHQSYILDQDNRIVDLVSEKTTVEAAYETLLVDHTIAQATLSYLLSNLDEASKQRALGYQDGVRSGLSL